MAANRPPALAPAAIPLIAQHSDYIDLINELNGELIRARLTIKVLQRQLAGKDQAPVIRLEDQPDHPDEEKGHA